MREIGERLPAHILITGLLFGSKENILLHEEIVGRWFVSFVLDEIFT